MRTHGGILDYPRETLNEKLWVYDAEDELPRLDPVLRELILSKAREALSQFKLRLLKCHLYGGAASYQYAEGSDVDCSVYACWDDFEGDLGDAQAYFKDIEFDFRGHPVHVFLKSPEESHFEVADAVYDVTNRLWIVPPLVLPDNFDPDLYFAPFIKEAEKRASQFDDDIGELVRAWSILEKASKALPDARDQDVVSERIEGQKEIIRELVEKLGTEFWEIRERRYAMHDRLREKLEEDIEVGRFERFQEPEIVWKYLDRSGYNDFLWKVYKTHRDGTIDDVLSRY